MRKVYSHENLAFVQMAKDLLATKNIDSFLKNEFHASGGHVGWESIPIELWVYNNELAEPAIALLQDQYALAKEATSWTCSKCAEHNAGSFETCWKCQTARVEQQNKHVI